MKPYVEAVQGTAYVVRFVIMSETDADVLFRRSVHSVTVDLIKKALYDIKNMGIPTVRRVLEQRSP